MKKFFRYIGEKGTPFFYHFFNVFALLFSSLKRLQRVYFFRRQIIEQHYFIGVTSLPLVLITSIFVGLVTSVQAVYQTQGVMIPKYLIAGAIYKSIILELGPVITALVLAGRIGAGMAAEIGTMKVSEQIDALESLALDPVGFLALPRIMAGTIMFPILTVFSNAVALFSGYSMGVFAIGINTYDFMRGMQTFYSFKELLIGLVKSMCFGIIITLIGSYMGLKTEGGAKGVGIATTTSVVTSLVLILVLDYIVADLFF